MDIEDAADICSGIDPSPWYYYCHICKKNFPAEDMVEDFEPHGELILLCPHGHYEVE